MAVAGNWEGAVLPGSNDVAQIPTDHGDAFLSTNLTVQRLYMGSTSDDSRHSTVTLEDGAYLNNLSGSPCQVGGVNGTGTLNVEAGATVESSGYFYVGRDGPETSYLNINGGSVFTVWNPSISNRNGLVLGASSTTHGGVINIYDSGTLDVTHINNKDYLSINGVVRPSYIYLVDGALTVEQQGTNGLNSMLANQELIIPYFSTYEYSEVVGLDGGGINTVTNTTITATASGGVIATTVPDVTGSILAGAEATLVVSNYSAGIISGSYSDTVPFGCVISQDPAAGETYGANLFVHLEISLGETTTLASFDMDAQSGPTQDGFHGTVPADTAAGSATTNGVTLSWSAHSAARNRGETHAKLVGNAQAKLLCDHLYVSAASSDPLVVGVSGLTSGSEYDITVYTYDATQKRETLWYEGSTTAGTLLEEHVSRNSYPSDAPFTVRLTADGAGEITLCGEVDPDYNIGNCPFNGLVVDRVLTAYEEWERSWFVDIGSDTNDYDGDLRANLWEYAFESDPTDILDVAGDPDFEASGGAIEYIHLQRNDDPKLVYSVETTLDLNGSWTNTGYTVSGTNVLGGSYDEVTNSIPTDADQTFIRMSVTLP